MTLFGYAPAQTAVVPDGKVEIRRIGLELDNGASIEVRHGLKPGDHGIRSPPANIANGMQVQEG
jgi:hypothetical protein